MPMSLITVKESKAGSLIQVAPEYNKLKNRYQLMWEQKDCDGYLKTAAVIAAYVDQAISSTINLPAWGSELNNDSKVQEFGNMLMKYLPKLRGITVYPDGCRGGQPLTPVKYLTAVKHVGEIFIEQADVCDITKGGSCGV
jgi:ribonucleoside-diphosphate reductase alpha chain